MPILTNAKHEQFSQSIARGIKATAAYVAAGYSRSGASASASRLMTKPNVSERIKELKGAIAQSAVAVEIRERSARLQVLQKNLDGMLRLIEMRAVENSGNPGGDTGMLVKELRGKNGEREVWKFDGPLVSQIISTLKQAAIEEGQWGEKRDFALERQLADSRARVIVARQRLEKFRRLEEANNAGQQVLGNAKHEQFAQSVATGTSGTEAYRSAGYSTAGAPASASRLLADPTVAARIEELKTSITEGVVEVDIRNRSKRVQVLQDIFNRMCNVIQARALEYSYHPGGATGLLERDYRGENAEEEIWKFDAGLMSRINSTMKQAAIEEGQWAEKRDSSATISNAQRKARINARRDRLAAEKKAALERGEPWPPVARILQSSIQNAS